MFKKLKDKLAEEVKSSPQRIQQFAQAAQAAVTSASSSISDITNSDLFSIGDNESQSSSKSQLSPSNQQSAFQDVSLLQPSTDSLEYASGNNLRENERQRKLSNSSFASDISFRLPSYETPMMYHLQSDMEVSASEAEERGLSSGAVSLDRVTKEQLYAAYRRTQERYKKYRTQYGDLARHYKLLERENAKARSVLVETQDKALRRISELREQCALEQSAKAHLEKALRVDIEERNMKIETLNTKINFLQSEAHADSPPNINENNNKNNVESESEQLIKFTDNETTAPSNESSTVESSILNEKIEKMEALLVKYKESLKTTKEKNSQLISELQILSSKIESKSNRIKELEDSAQRLTDANEKIQELNNHNEDLQNKINAYDFTKTKEVSALEDDLRKANDEIIELQKKIDVFTKREEENAISLAENKLSIHKELESKENEIKSLKESLTVSINEVQSLSIVIDEYKTNIAVLEDEKTKQITEINELQTVKIKNSDLEMKLQDVLKKSHVIEQSLTKLNEEYKCLQLQSKQETAEKLAMIDRNVYLENRNTQLTEENSKKSSQINLLESELQTLKNLQENNKEDHRDSETEKNEIINELNQWKTKYNKLELEMQEERDELVKLQSEIEKLLSNHELIQNQNTEYRSATSTLQSENSLLNKQLNHYHHVKKNCGKLAGDISKLQTFIKILSQEAKANNKIYNEMFITLKNEINVAISEIITEELQLNNAKCEELRNTCYEVQNELDEVTSQQKKTTKNLIKLQQENKSLCSEIKELSKQREESDIIVEKYQNTIEEINSIRNENNDLKSELTQTKSQLESLQAAFELEKLKHLNLNKTLSLAQSENKTFLDKINQLEHANEVMKVDQEKMKNKCKDNLSQISATNDENTRLLEMVTLLEKQVTNTRQLEENVKTLTNENISLKSQTENIASNLSQLEIEMNDVRKSHATIESEKDRLNSIIVDLESRQSSEFSETKETQTDTSKEFKKYIQAETQTIIENCNENSRKLNSDKKIANLNELSNEYTTLKNNYDVLKEENRRLQSDIEGLQTHLTKISKENSTLNDKLRESIATGDHLLSGDPGNNIHDLNNEIESCKEKIEYLSRENTILIEENLELKDQLQPQNYTSNVELNSQQHNSNEIAEIREKYYALMQANVKSDQKLIDLEQINKLLNENMQEVQAKNEKLKCTNEKIERRLDEALVSLRHLHSLEENTELEYLRNILYEYLTGSGTHSVTLAKVLAAVVKFDEKQTKMVLSKEKERQGFLRQLGII